MVLSSLEHEVPVHFGEKYPLVGPHMHKGDLDDFRRMFPFFIYLLQMLDANPKEKAFPSGALK